jgi:hypothetical protein
VKEEEEDVVVNSVVKSISIFVLNNRSVEEKVIIRKYTMHRER